MRLRPTFALSDRDATRLEQAVAVTALRDAAEPTLTPGPHPEFACEVGDEGSIHGAFSDFLVLLDECLGNDRLTDDALSTELEGLADAPIEERMQVAQLMLAHGLTHEVPFELAEFTRDESPFMDLLDPLDEDGAAWFDSGVVSEWVSDGAVDYVLPESAGKRAGQVVKRNLVRRGNFRHVREFEPSHFDVPPKRWDAGVDVDHPSRGVEAIERYEEILLRSQVAREDLSAMLRRSYFPLDLSSFTSAEREALRRTFTEELVMPVDHVELFCSNDDARLMPEGGRPTRFREPNQRVVRETTASSAEWDPDSRQWVFPGGEPRFVEATRLLPAALQLFSCSADPDLDDGLVRVRRMVTPFAVWRGDELRLYGPGAGAALDCLTGDEWRVGSRGDGEWSPIRRALLALDSFAAQCVVDVDMVRTQLSDGCDHDQTVPNPGRGEHVRKRPAERVAELELARERAELIEASQRWRAYIEAREELGWEFVGVNEDGQPQFLRPVAAEASKTERKFWLTDDWREWDANQEVRGASRQPRKWNTALREHPLRHPLMRGDR